MGAASALLLPVLLLGLLPSLVLGACDEDCSPLVSKVAAVCTHGPVVQEELAEICNVWRSLDGNPREEAPAPSVPRDTAASHTSHASQISSSHARREATDVTRFLSQNCSDACTYGGEFSSQIICTIEDASARLLDQGAPCVVAFKEYAESVRELNIEVRSTMGEAYSPPLWQWNLGGPSVSGLTLSSCGPDVVSALRNSSLLDLKTLNLMSNTITGLPPGVFDKLTALTELDFSNNQITQLPPGVFDELTAVTQLSFTNNQITQLPQGLFDNHSNLAGLNFHSNQITQLPPGVFDKVTALTQLAFSDNQITQLPPGMFDELTALTELYFDNNQITQLPPRVFDKLTALTELGFYNAQITQLPPGVFDKLTALTWLSFFNNQITQLPPRVFDKLTALTQLFFYNNKITQLPPGVFDELTALTELYFDDNQITQLPPGVFDKLTPLTQLDFSDNQITQLPPRAFDKLTALTWLSFYNNKITQLPPGVFDNLTPLTQLGFSNNQITQLPPGVFDKLTALIELFFSDNQITQLPPGVFDKLTPLAQLFFSDNQITQLPPGVFDEPTALVKLYFSNNKITHLSPGVFGKLTALTQLGFSNNLITQLPPGVFDKLAALTFLDMSSNQGALVDSSALNTLTRLTFLGVAKTSMSELPPLASSLQYLNVSSNPELVIPQYLFRVESLKTLDVSGARITSSDMKCHRADNLHRMSLLSARNLDLSSVNKSQAFSSFATSCLTLVDVIDLSDNDLTDFTFINKTLSEITYILPVSDDDTDGNNAISQLKLGDKNPVRCSLDISTTSRSLGFASTSLPALRFNCSCTIGFHVSSDGTCKRDPPFWTHPKVAGLVVGVFFLSLFVVLAALAALVRHRRVRADLELKQLLLEETQEEVMVLKRAWEIAPAELKLERRIDGDSPGAFGEVWRAQWDGITVAVKLLQQAAMDFDEEAADEFQREIEFMQKTRHPSIVRFFGAGQWHTGVPFFVIELVGLGSLKVFLRGKGSEVRDVDWGTKMRLALDVARGMAHIHSLGQMHRDLKSGNVLITEEHRAKITDFGTIRDLLTRRQRRRNSKVSQSSSRASQVFMGSLELTAGKGTPLYMAPEVIRGGEYAQSADVWSFGVVLWELAAQRSPDLLQQEGKVRGPLLGNLLDVLERGVRLRVDERWPAWYAELMGGCWRGRGEERPGFEEIVAVLESKGGEGD